MGRVSQIAQQTLMLRNILNAEERVQTAQIQIGTGKKSLSYAGIAQDASQLVSLKGLHPRIDGFMRTNTTIERRLERMDSSVSAVFDAMSELRTLLLQGLNAATGSNVPVGTVAQDLLDVVVGLLNAKDDGRYLFGGTKTTTQPVQSPVPDPTTFGVADNTYYNGNAVELTTRVDENTTISYGMTADRLGFQQAIGALKAAIEGANTQNRVLLESGLDLANDAIRALSGYRTEIGSDLQTIERADLRNGDFITYIESVISDIENVNIPAAVTQLASEQTLLEASFLTLARVNSLSLVDFLS